MSENKIDNEGDFAIIDMIGKGAPTTIEPEAPVKRKPGRQRAQQVAEPTAKPKTQSDEIDDLIDRLNKIHVWENTFI